MAAAGGILIVQHARRAPLVLVLALAFCAPAVATHAPGAPASAPDVPAATEPIAVRTVLEDEVWSFTAGFRGTDVAVPEGWDRVVLEFTQVPLGDPWDRTFAASIAGVEVLRGTTPRTPMTVEKDVTRYASLLPEGGVARVEGYTDTYVGAMSVTLKLRFYADATSLLVEPAADAVANVARFAGLCTGASVSRTVTFAADAPAEATLELFLSGHGGEEFWFQGAGTRTVRVLVDGVEVGHATMLPYTYAFLGFAGANGQAGPREMLVHQIMWWTAQQGLDKAGVHANSGEIPPFRIALHEEHLPLLMGERTVTVQMEQLLTGPARCTWTTSAAFVLGA